MRACLLGHMAEVVGARGCGDASVAHVLTAADCARATFYRHFANFDDCFACAHDATVRHIEELAMDAWSRRSAHGHSAAFAAVIERLAAFSASRPAIARFWLCEALAGGGDAAWRRHERLVEHLALLASPMFERGAAAPDRRPSALASTYVLAVLAQLRDRLLTDDPVAVEALPRHAMEVAAAYAPRTARGGTIPDVPLAA